MNRSKSFSVEHEVTPFQYLSSLGSRPVQVKVTLAYIQLSGVFLRTYLTIILYYVSNPRCLSPCNLRTCIPIFQHLGVFLRAIRGHHFLYSNPCSVSLCNIRRPFPYFIFNLRLSFHLFKLLGPFLSACYDLPFLFQLLEQQNGDLSHRLFKLIWVFLQAT